MRRDQPNPIQRIVNARPPSRHWDVPDQPWQRWVRVHARIEWQHDGEEWIVALAKRWKGTRVWVQFPDVRLYGGGVWIDARDVRRR